MNILQLSTCFLLENTRLCAKKQRIRKAEFNKFEQEDLKCREALKHVKSKRKKLEKMIEQETKKVKKIAEVT